MNQPIPRSETVQISSDGVYRGVSVHIPYPLESDEFLKLTKVNSLLPIWAHSFFTGTSLFLINVLSKWIDNKFFSGTNTIASSEVITLCILVVLAIILEALYLSLPSAKKDTLKKIEKHFEDNKPKAAGFGND